MSVKCNVTYLYLESTSMYEGTCSPYDSANDKYLSYQGKHSAVFQLKWQSCLYRRPTIYPINTNEVNCTGLVTALKFCYNTAIPRRNPFARVAFNFLLINRQPGNEFKVAKSIPVRATSKACCRNFDGQRRRRRCCEIMKFNTSDQFKITSSNVTAAMVGFSTQVATQYVCLAWLLVGKS